VKTRIALIVLGFAVSAAGPAAAGRPSGARLDPGRFAALATGIVLVRAYDCSGTARVEGTGFLVGARVVMTASHVVDGACTTKVQTSDGTWIPVDRATEWYGGRSNVAAVDLATLRLHTGANGHLFTIRTWSPGVGAGVAMLGHPLGGQQLSITQGRVAWKGHMRARPGVPLLVLRLLGAQGASGSPIVDDNGRVVSILQIGLGSRDTLGQETSGTILGIDLPSWWPNAKQNLCQAYPLGGVANC
jgi:S1-C subfamily serine protease